MHRGVPQPGDQQQQQSSVAAPRSSLMAATHTHVCSRRRIWLPACEPAAARGDASEGNFNSDTVALFQAVPSRPQVKSPLTLLSVTWTQFQIFTTSRWHVHSWYVSTDLVESLSLLCICSWKPYWPPVNKMSWLRMKGFLIVSGAPDCTDTWGRRSLTVLCCRIHTERRRFQSVSLSLGYSVQFILSQAVLPFNKTSILNIFIFLVCLLNGRVSHFCNQPSECCKIPLCVCVFFFFL